MSKKQKLLEWLQRVEGGLLLESQVTASGLSAALNELLREGRAEMVAHHTVRERGGAPAAAVKLAPAAGVEVRRV